MRVPVHVGSSARGLRAGPAKPLREIVAEALLPIFELDFGLRCLFATQLGAD